jgi:DNA/RNA endonuclease YhcR with UshA esterase domain
MKRFSTILVCASLVSFSLIAGETNAVTPKKIGATEADKHYNETLTVTGKVAQVTIREKLVFINLDKPHPDSPLTAIVFATHTNQFGDLAKLKDRPVEITGMITNYHDSPEIVLESSNQLKIVEQPMQK